MLATSVGTNTNLAERSGLFERLIQKPISYIDITALLSSGFICGKDGNNSGLPEMKGKVSIGLLMKAIERAFLRPQGTVSILTREHDVAILCMQHGMPLVVTVSHKYQTDKVVPDQDAVVKLSKIYRKGCENLKLFLIGMWGSYAASVL
ncbi:hypothetical protein JHK84_050009 [Glycine max]|nr:hypothetical protein JHK84_050009 [Glycine max]